MKALVTGASSGIGRDMAKELAKRNIDLILVSRDLEKLQDVKNQIVGALIYPIFVSLTLRITNLIDFGNFL